MEFGEYSCAPPNNYAKCVQKVMIKSSAVFIVYFVQARPSLIGGIGKF